MPLCIRGEHNLEDILRHHPKHQLIIAGRLETLQSISAFCRRVYLSAFGEKEGEERYAKLTLAAAVDLWKTGLPESRSVVQ